MSVERELIQKHVDGYDLFATFPNGMTFAVFHAPRSDGDPAPWANRSGDRAQTVDVITAPPGNDWATCEACGLVLQPQHPIAECAGCATTELMADIKNF